MSLCIDIQVQQLRGILEGLQSRRRERTWLRNQGVGELDDAKLGMIVNTQNIQIAQHSRIFNIIYIPMYSLEYT
jgi:hypothetical protein